MAQAKVELRVNGTVIDLKTISSGGRQVVSGSVILELDPGDLVDVLLTNDGYGSTIKSIGQQSTLSIMQISFKKTIRKNLVNNNGHKFNN